jgi:alpha-galactosidase
MYRSHPEWVLEHRGYGHVFGRHQLVVDLTNRDAYAYVRDQLDNLLSSHDIAYLKWDMNRPHVAASTTRGAAATHAQTLAVYQLLDELRLMHPHVEIESCSSGGGRIDHEILKRTERVWASDTNDPVRRQTIQRNLSIFVPPEMIGCHVGPPVAHTTGRKSSLSMRAVTACVGHMGVEWNLLDATDHERASLTRAIAHHKQLRSVLHTGMPLGATFSKNTNDSLVFYGVVAPDGGTAVATIAHVDDSDVGTSTVHVVGLDPQRMYAVIRVDITGDDPQSATRRPKWWHEKCMMSGAQLADDGLELPEMLPESAVLLTMTPS